MSLSNLLTFKLAALQCIHFIVVILLLVFEGLLYFDNLLYNVLYHVRWQSRFRTNYAYINGTK